MILRMNYGLLQQLKQWRDEQARIEGVESYRVLNNAALEALITRMPTSLAELLEVKGIKEAKSRRYGKTLLQMIQVQQSVGGAESGAVAETDLQSMGAGGRVAEFTESAMSEPVTDQPLTVSQFLDSLNIELSGMAARLRGEVSECNIWNNAFVFFSLKDNLDGSVLKCGMPYARYQVCGIDVAVGDEVIVEGFPKMYKPRGELSLQVGTIEYAGEGELKRAYDALYRKLELAGAFAAQQKRPIPEFVERIALITSRDGAAIGDFTMNLVRAGLSVDFYPTLVEGKRAVFEILKAIQYFNQRPEHYDALVIIRGGGSLESLQAFNTEALVEAVRKSKIPVLAGIGHERDVSLTALAADRMVSTPTAAARALSLSWDEARVRVGQYALTLERSVQQFQMMLATTIRHAEEVIRSALESLSHRILVSDGAFRNAVHRFPEQCRMIRMKLANDSATWQVHLRGSLKQCGERLATMEERLRQFDPVRVLRLGYAIVRKAGRLVRGATDGIAVGDRIDIQLGQGRLESEVIEITEHV